jgi:hypothetical protein
MAKLDGDAGASITVSSRIPVEARLRASGVASRRLEAQRRVVIVLDDASASMERQFAWRPMRTQRFAGRSCRENGAAPLAAPMKRVNCETFFRALDGRAQFGTGRVATY